MKYQKSIKLDHADNRQIEELHLISGENLESIHNVMRAFVISFAIQQKEGEPIRLPYFGDFKVAYDRSKAEYDIKITLHPALKRLVKQISDEEVSGDHTQNDAYRLLMSEVKESLREIIATQ